MLHSSIKEQKSRTQTFHSVTYLGYDREIIGSQAGTAWNCLPARHMGRGKFVLHDH